MPLRPLRSSPHPQLNRPVKDRCSPRPPPLACAGRSATVPVVCATTDLHSRRATTRPQDTAQCGCTLHPDSPRSDRPGVALRPQAVRELNRRQSADVTGATDCNAHSRASNSPCSCSAAAATTVPQITQIDINHRLCSSRRRSPGIEQTERLHAAHRREVEPYNGPGNRRRRRRDGDLTLRTTPGHGSGPRGLRSPSRPTNAWMMR